MNRFDLLLLLLAALLITLGMIKGLVRILIGTAALVAAFALAAVYHQPLAARLGWQSASPGTQALVSWGLIVVGVLLAGGLVVWFLRKALTIAHLGWVDRLGGGALGLVAATLIAAFVILPLAAYPGAPRLLDGSVLAPRIAPVSDLASPLVPDDLERRYHEGVDGLRRAWRARAG